LGLFFCGVAVFFEDVRVVCFWACFLQISLLRIFFSNFMALLLFQFTAEGRLGVFLRKFAHFRLDLSDFPLCFFI